MTRPFLDCARRIVEPDTNRLSGGVPGSNHVWGAIRYHPPARGGVERCREQSWSGTRAPILNLNANLALAAVNGSGKSNSAQLV